MPYLMSFTPVESVHEAIADEWFHHSMKYVNARRDRDKKAMRFHRLMQKAIIMSVGKMAEEDKSKIDAIFRKRM